MNDDEKLVKAEEIINKIYEKPHVKILKTERGLIERTESSRMVITEDNRQVLGD